MLKPIQLFCILLVQRSQAAPSTTPQHDGLTSKMCKEINSTQYTVTWPSTADVTISHPPCVDIANQFVYRRCFGGHWVSEPECSYVQYETPPQCPDGYTEYGNFCYKFTEDTTFPPNCDFPNVLPFKSFISQIVDKLPGPVWMPITRDMSNGYGFLQWVEASSLYKTDYEGQVLYDGDIKGKDCLLYSRHKAIMAVSCKEKHPGVCAYQFLTQRASRVCEEGCWQSSYASRTRCFCMEEYPEPYEKEAEFIQPYQNNLYSLVTSDICSIGLKKLSNGTYVWNNTFREINYTFWSPDVTFASEYVYGAASTNGWILTKETVPCTLVEKEVPLPELIVDLDYDRFSDTFWLKVSDPMLLQEFEGNVSIFCFTDADNTSLVYRLDNVSDGLTVSLEDDYFHFSSLGVSGNYWCEVFKYADLKPIQTQKKFVRIGPYFEFALFLEIGYSSWITNPLSSNITYIVKSKFIDTFNSRRTSYVPRIMKILEVFESYHTVWVNIHFSSHLELIETNVTYQYQYLSNHINGILSSSSKLYKLSFYNVDYCLGDVTISSPDVVLTWPQTPIGTTVTPEEFCFTMSGRLVTRRCSGDFISGASWSDYEKCKNLKSSTVTQQLLPYYKGLRLTTPGTVNEIITRNYPSRFNDLDVFLMGQILNVSYANTTNFDLTAFVSSINSISQIDRCEIIQSQIAARTTDNILHLINIVAQSYPVPEKVVTDNFAIFMYPSQNISGVIVQESGSGRTVQKLTGNWTVDEIGNQSDLVAAIWLSPELRARIGDETKIAFTIFFNNTFFGESISTTNVVDMVFGVNIDGYYQNDYLQKPIRVLQKIASDDKMKRTCSFWSYQLSRQAGFWVRDGTYKNMNELQYCSFQRTSNFAIVASYNEFVESNVTPNLVSLLDNEYVWADMVDMLVSLSGQYDEFVPMDIFLFGKVLESANDNQETDIASLTRTISNLHYTNRTVLSQSQEEKQATDIILSYIDAIIENVNSSSEVLHQTDNFVVLISDTRKYSFNGLVVLKINDSYQVEILREFSTNETILEYVNVDSALILSPLLARQMVEDSKVIVTIYFTDSLFNSQTSNHTGISTIFGVIIPQVGNYSGPVSIFHNVSGSTYDLACSHWNYKQTNQSESYWFKNDDAQNASKLFQCDYWHTTHFALLLLDKNKYYDSYQILEWITYINSGVSFVGLFGIVLTAFLFKKWRKNIGNQILFNFTLAIMIQIGALFGVSVVDKDSTFDCILMGALLHYSVVAQFCWMLVIAVLQFKRFVKVFATSPKYLLLKTCLCGWGIPIVPVIIAWSINNQDYFKGNTGFCYPSGWGLYLGVWLPLLLVITLNLCIFIYIMYNVIQRKVEPSTAPKNDSKYQWRLFVLLFFMLGMTWTFGFLAELDFGEPFAYLFCLTATLQGFVLFLYFIVLNSNTRYMYKHAFKTYCRKDN